MNHTDHVQMDQADGALSFIAKVYYLFFHLYQNYNNIIIKLFIILSFNLSLKWFFYLREMVFTKWKWNVFSALITYLNFIAVHPTCLQPMAFVFLLMLDILPDEPFPWTDRLHRTVQDSTLEISSSCRMHMSVSVNIVRMDRMMFCSLLSWEIQLDY